jgi:DNA repair protein RecO (recombination protein O)
MIIKSKGIVLRSVKYSETSLILDIFTRELGLRTYIVSGVRKKNAKVSAGMLQPMNILDLVAYNRETSSMNRIKEVNMSYVFRTLPFNIKKSSIALFIIEIIGKSIKEKEKNIEFFNFIENSLIYLDQTNNNISNFHLVFLVKMCDFLGFKPVNNYSESNMFFDLREGVFNHNPPYHGDYLRKISAKNISSVLESDLENSALLSFNRNEKYDTLQNLILFYKIHLIDFGKIKTLEIFKSVFDPN